MAITNAQQYQQLVNKRADGKRPGYRGDDAARSDAASGRDAGRSGPGAADDRGSAEQNANQRAQVRAGQVRALENLIDRPPVGFTDAARINLFNYSPTSLAVKGIKNLGTAIANSKIGQFMNAKQREAYLDSLDTDEQVAALEALGKIGIGTTNPMGIDRNITRGTEKGIFGTNIGGGQFITDPNLGSVEAKTALGTGYQDYLDDITSRFDNTDGGDGGQTYIPPVLTPYQEDVVEEVDPNSLQGLLANRMAYRFMANGGRAAYQDGSPAVDPRMARSLQENVAANEAQRASNQSFKDMVVQGAQQNLQRHFANNELLRDAVSRGELSSQDYNKLGGYDYTQNVTGGEKITGGLTNLLGSPVYNLIQAFKGEQDFSPILGTALRNAQGGFGMISDDLKSQYENIVNQQPSAMPQGSPDTIITEGDSRYRINADGSRSLIGKIEDAPIIDRPTMADVAGAAKTDPRAGIQEAFLNELLTTGPNQGQLLTSVMPDFDRYGTYTGDDQLLKDYAAAGRGTPTSQLVKLPANHPYAGTGPGYYEYNGTDFSKTADLNMTPEYEKMIRLNYGLATGGRVGLMGGGMPDDFIGGLADGNLDEMGRQMYGLGKLVKKATRAVKKIVKSPVGKAALLAGGAGLFGYGPAAGLFSSGKGLAFKEMLAKGILKKGATDFTLANLSPFKTIGLASLASGLMSQPEEDEEEETYYRGPGLDIAAIRRDPYAARGAAYGFYAEGGDVKEPVAKDTMPLLDMNGMEKDYRADGGFVPIGRMERADDVPARLSKNEFVFTADAVRNAGDGDVDKGAEVMYNMMKNLESGGKVSEESQGLDGARDMFQTSKRLEEVL